MAEEDRVRGLTVWFKFSNKNAALLLLSNGRSRPQIIKWGLAAMAPDERLAFSRSGEQRLTRGALG